MEGFVPGLKEHEARRAAVIHSDDDVNVIRNVVFCQFSTAVVCTSYSFRHAFSQISFRNLENAIWATNLIYSLILNIK
jgi:hypothetical protein